MFRVPKWSIVAFVFCAVVAAYFVHHFFEPAKKVSPTGSGNYSSMSSPTSFDQALPGSPHDQGAIATLVDEIPGKLQSIANGGSTDKTACQCTVAGTGSADLELEKASQCGPGRLKFETALTKLAPIFREERAKKSADFPSTCITYIMHKFLQGTEKNESSAMSSCKSPNAQPDREAFKPCITATYVNSIYNSFADMTSCMGVPQRDYLPKLYNESGFHINTLGAGFDAGVNQLVGPTIEEANKDFKAYRAQVLASKNEACQRVAPYIKKFSPVSDDVKHRCQLIAPPNNPLLNIFYMTIKYQQDLQTLDKRLKDRNIVNRLTQLGLSPDKYSQQQLTQMLMILGFNSGISGAVINFDNYLKKVELGKRKLTLDDFNFSKESLIYAKIDSKTHNFTRRTVDDSTKWKDRMKAFDAVADKYKEQKPRYKAKIEKITAVSKKWGKYSTYHLNFKDSELSFSAYLQLYQSSGAPGYLSFVRRAADELNSVFKEGTCVPDSYLAL